MNGKKLGFWAMGKGRSMGKNFDVWGAELKFELKDNVRALLFNLCEQVEGEAKQMFSSWALLGMSLKVQSHPCWNYTNYAKCNTFMFQRVWSNVALNIERHALCFDYLLSLKFFASFGLQVLGWFDDYKGYAVAGWLMSKCASNPSQHCISLYCRNFWNFNHGSWQRRAGTWQGLIEHLCHKGFTRLSL